METGAGGDIEPVVPADMEADLIDIAATAGQVIQMWANWMRPQIEALP